LRHRSPRSFRCESGFPSASLRLGVSALNSRSDPTQRRRDAEALRRGDGVGGQRPDLLTVSMV
jgi:hypothetical protein